MNHLPFCLLSDSLAGCFIHNMQHSKHHYRVLLTWGTISARIYKAAGCLLQMILDKKFAGTLDQGAGCLEVFEGAPKQQVYDDMLSIMDTLGSVVDTLFTRSQHVIAAV